MRLRQIEMQGFKSFAEKTKIEFPQGLTVVIGPNGSGKSNISDAVRWVLGEMSLKSLRGNKMEDVIFNGTQKRQPANYTSVSLYLDTSEEYDAAKNGEEAQIKDRIRLSDEPEVVITRRYYRTGESEYYINKKQVRLKDIYELFYDTGIGREGYSVIGQGAGDPVDRLGSGVDIRLNEIIHFYSPVYFSVRKIVHYTLYTFFHNKSTPAGNSSGAWKNFIRRRPLQLLTFFASGTIIE